MFKNATLIRRRLQQQSEDETVITAALALVRRLRAAQAGFLFIGSCALQAWLGYGHRTPHDLDVIIDKDSEARWLDHCRHTGLDITIKPARMFCTVEGMPVHVLTGGMGQVDLGSSRVFDFISLDPTTACASIKTYRLPGSKRSLRIPVPSPEVLLALTLLRPINANTVLDALCLLKACEISFTEFQTFIKRSPAMTAIVPTRLTQLGLILSQRDASLLERHQSLFPKRGVKTRQVAREHR